MVRSGKSGFSLVELLVVIFIIGLLIGWVVPNFNSFLLRIKLQNSSRQAEIMLRNAARHSVGDRRTVHVTVYDRLSGTTPNSLKADIDQDIRDSPYDDWELMPDGFVEMISPILIAEMSADEFMFEKYGTASKTGSLYITLCLPDAPNWISTPVLNASRTDYNTITISGQQRARLYEYLHKS